jgi:hypothetical protein
VAVTLLELGANPAALDAIDADCVKYVAKQQRARWTKALAAAKKSAKPAAKAPAAAAPKAGAVAR